MDTAKKYSVFSREFYIFLIKTEEGLKVQLDALGDIITKDEARLLLDVDVELNRLTPGEAVAIRTRMNLDDTFPEVDTLPQPEEIFHRVFRLSVLPVTVRESQTKEEDLKSPYGPS